MVSARTFAGCFGCPWYIHWSHQGKRPPQEGDGWKSDLDFFPWISAGKGQNGSGFLKDSVLGVTEPRGLMNNYRWGSWRAILLYRIDDWFGGHLLMLDLLVGHHKQNLMFLSTYILSSTLLGGGPTNLMSTEYMSIFWLWYYVFQRDWNHQPEKQYCGIEKYMFKLSATTYIFRTWFVLAFFFPERRFVAGFFRRLLAYLTPHISHTYPAHFTYPTHIHFKRIHHTYPTHIQHIAHIPHISIPNVSHTYVSHQYVSMQCVSIQKVVIRIPPITTNIPYISSTSYISHTYPFQTYPFQTYPTNTCPLQTYPFKRCASAGIANVSHQYISHQYVSSTRIPPVRIHSMRIHSKSLHQQEWLWVWASLHIISYHSYHCYSAGMVMNIKTLLFLQFFAKLLIEYNFIARVWTWNSLLAIGLSACLPVVCFCACFLIIFYYSIPPGGMGRVNRKATLSLKTRRRSPKTVAKRKFHLLAVNPLGKNVVSIAQNCSETQISFSAGEPSR